MAGPCVLVNSFMTSFVMYYILQYRDNFTYYASLMFGAIISATDPVAVVSMMKAVGSSKKLSHIVEGESLFNDGTAMVLFIVVHDFFIGKPKGFFGILL